MSKIKRMNMTSVTDKTQCTTGTSNEIYDLVSVVYHALEGAVTYDQYIEDAKSAGDNELASFFEELKDNNCQMANKAKSLLKSRMD
ncbi:hypothetical protein cce_3529 [Crocosphaera subtropica ATCC 51142]|uniref:Uncharacterized protein n=2 Tax=Crocosphaera TaxID=263510 RepID=B1WZX8_CROS5|nr:hypothetical protein cce_3529 [Crocosphaera subtropica ATCC 51142]